MAECWSDLALKNPGSVVVEKWEAALKYIRPLNSLVHKGVRDSEFLKVIVDNICAVVPADIKLDDSHIQGRSRLCKVIEDKIDLQLESKSKGVCMVGFYGTGGMGKTTICKALCNEFFIEFRGRVCHAELERMSEKELLRDVLRRLSNTRGEFLNGLNENEEKEFIRDPVFLAIDNMPDSNASVMQAKSYLSGRLPVGSIMMVTSRYKESLAPLREYIDENECMKMPELELEEARCLFEKSSEGRIDDDRQLVERCVQRCQFYDDDRRTSYHYHPLALDVLDPEEWGAQLDTTGR